MEKRGKEKVIKIAGLAAVVIIAAALITEFGHFAAEINNGE